VALNPIFADKVSRKLAKYALRSVPAATSRAKSVAQARFSIISGRIVNKRDSMEEWSGFEPSYMDPAPVASRSID
jgi:hypothetical protein